MDEKKPGGGGGVTFPPGGSTSIDGKTTGRGRGRGRISLTSQQGRGEIPPGVRQELQLEKEHRTGNLTTFSHQLTDVP